MAVLGKIRKRVGLLIGFVGVSMVLFILGDLVTSNSGLLGRNSDVVGVIAGEKIHYPEYERRYEEISENYKANQKKDNVDPSAQDMLREQSWNMFINDLVIKKEYEDLGISCSNQELYEMCTGKNPNPQVRQAFTDPKTGQWDPNAVIRFLKDLPNREEAVQRQWRAFEDAIREERISEKYKTIIRQGLYVSTPEAQRSLDDQLNGIAIRFLRLDYNTIPDTSVKIENDDLTAYYNENKNKYKQPETVRRAEYVAFDITPSQDDRDAVMSFIKTKRDEFAQSTNDAMFITQNSDAPFDSAFYPKGTLKPEVDSLFFHSPIGTMYGPFEEGNNVKVWKLTAEKMVSDSVKARHILIPIENNDTAKALATADSLKNAIKKGSKFEPLAMMFSKDQGSAIKGGDLGWFTQGAMVKPFNDACFNGKVGDMPIVTSEFGVHLIEITDKTAATKRIQVAILNRNMEPSQKTFDLLYNKANEFAAKNNTAEAFEAAIVKEGLNKRLADNVRENDKNIPGLDQPRELVRWIYTAKVGDISKVYTIGDKYVIAHLTAIREKGFLPLDAVKDQVTSEVRKIKKGEMLAEKFSAAGTSIDAIAQKLNMTVEQTDGVTLANTFVSGIGNEPKIVGGMFGYKDGQLTKPLKGDNGVVIAFIKSSQVRPPQADVSFKSNEMMNQLRSRADYEVFNALKENAKIEDNRGKFF